MSAKRAEEARKEEEAEEGKRQKEVEAEKEKERVAAERLKSMKQGNFGGNSSVPKPPQSKTPFVRKNTIGSAMSSTVSSLPKSLPEKTENTLLLKSNDGASSATTSSIATASTSRTTSSSRKEDPAIAKSKMLGDIGKIGLGSLRKSKTDTTNKATTENSKIAESSPSGTKRILEKSHKSWGSKTPLKSNITPGAKTDFIKLIDEEKKEDNESSPPMLLNQGSELTESPTPPLLTSVSSPSNDFVSIDSTNHTDSFETPSGWGKRLSAADIKAQIEAVAAEDEGDDEEESIEHEAQDLNLGPNAFYSPGFDQAIRNSNASWDRRPSSRDIMARIKEAEELEAKHSTLESDRKRADLIRSGNCKKTGTDGLTMIDEDQTTKTVEVRRKAKPGDDDSVVSELSMTTYEDNPLDGRSIPQSLFLRQDSANANVPFSPALTSSPSLGFLGSKGSYNEKAQEAIRMVKTGDISLPPLPVIPDESSSTVKSDSNSIPNPKVECKEETEEEKVRRERAGKTIH